MFGHRVLEVTDAVAVLVRRGQLRCLSQRGCRGRAGGGGGWPQDGGRGHGAGVAGAPQSRVGGLHRCLQHRGLKTEGWQIVPLKVGSLFCPADIMPTDGCEINNNSSDVREIIEHILKGRYRQKLRTGDGRHKHNEFKLAPQSDWDKRGGNILFYHHYYTAVTFSLFCNSTHSLQKCHLLASQMKGNENVFVKSPSHFYLDSYILVRRRVNLGGWLQGYK